MDNRICIVLEWTPEEASLLQDQPSLLQRPSISQGNIGDSHQTFCMRLVLVSFTLLICSCMFIIIETLHDQSFSLTSEDTEPQRLQTTSYWVPEDQRTGVITSQCMKLVLVSFTQLHNYCHFTLMFARGTCAS